MLEVVLSNRLSPSKIRGHFITCIECITNPKTWINNPFC